MVGALAILMVGYSAAEAGGLRDLLEQGGLSAKVDCVAMADMLPGRLQQQEWDLVLTDDRPDLSAAQVLGLLAKLGLDVPVIALVSRQDEQAAAHLIAAGVQDVLLKSDPVQLMATIRGCQRYIGHLRDLR